MQAEPTVAVVVPVFNEQRELPEFIRRISAINVDELIVVDGGSTDRSRILLEESGLHWMRSEPGRARQMNAASAICNSDIILFIHVDTIIDSTHVSAVREAMGDADCVGGRFDVAIAGTHPALSVIAWFMNVRSRLSRISTGDQCIFVRRSVFEELGGFPSLPLMEDVAFSTLLRRAGRIACLREKVITSGRRWELHGVVKTVWVMWKMRLLYWLGTPAEKLALMYRDAR